MEHCKGKPGEHGEPQDSVVTTETETHSKTTTTTTYGDGGDGQAQPVAQATADESDTSGLTAKLEYEGFPQGSVTVAWGDNQEGQADGPEGELTHAYGEETRGQEVTITLTGEDNTSAEATFTPGETGS